MSFCPSLETSANNGNLKDVHVSLKYAYLKKNSMPTFHCYSVSSDF